MILFQMNFEKNKDNYEPIGASLTDSKLPKKTKRQTIKITHNPDSGTSNIFIHKRIRSHAQIKPIKREKRDKKKSLVHICIFQVRQTFTLILQENKSTRKSDFKNEKLNFKINFLWKLPEAISFGVDVMKHTRSNKKPTDHICKGFTKKNSQSVQKSINESYLCKINGLKLNLQNKKIAGIKNDFIDSRMSYTQQEVFNKSLNKDL